MRMPVNSITALLAAALLLGGCNTVEGEVRPATAASTPSPAVLPPPCLGCDALPAALPDLSRAIAAGLPQTVRADAERRIGATYDMLARSSATPAPDKAKFIALYLRRADAAYRVAAADRIAAAGGPEARQVLERALSAELAPEVKASVARRLALMP